MVWLYQQHLSNPSILHQEGKLGSWKIQKCKRNLNRQCQWNINRFLQKQSAWESIKNWLLEAADETCGWTQGGCPWHKETWWWNNDVENAVKEKQKTWEQWKNEGTMEDYLKAKKAAKTAVYFAEMNRQNSLTALTMTVIKITFLKWLRD